LDSGGTTLGVINDQFGNGVASVTGSTVTWFATRVGAYGPLPGTQAATLTDITQLAAATAWRGRRIDPTGFYNLGARCYDPVSGRFLSADPMGQAASPSLYDFAGGDPVNFFDPTGRCPDNSNRYPNGLYKPTEVNTNGAPAVPIGWGQNSADPNLANTGPGLFDGVLGAAVNGLYNATVGAVVNTYNAGVNNIAGAVISAQNGDFAMAALQGTAAAGNVASLALTAAGLGEIAVTGGEALAGSLADSAGADVSAATPIGRSGNPLSIVTDEAGTPLNTPANIGGRDYVGHALDSMQSDGIMPSVVEDAIANGDQMVGKVSGTTAYYSQSNNVTVITDAASGRVVTVSRGFIKQ